MPRYARLRVAEVRDVRPGLQRMTLGDGSEAYALTDLCGPVEAGDEVLVNVSAVELGLGTGGAHVVHTNLSTPFLGGGAHAADADLGAPRLGDAGGPDAASADRFRHGSAERIADLSSPRVGAVSAGRVMKARYLSEQLAVATLEEFGQRQGDSGDGEEMTSLAGGDAGDGGSDEVQPSLTGVRVVLCVLHSHAMALAAATRDVTDTALGYVMTDGGALPFVLSDLAAACLERGVIATAVSAGQAFGAPMESVTVAGGVAALASQGIDRVIVSPGPGHLGTASPLGFSALDLAGHAAVLDGLGAATAVAARASADDERERHRGLSHHTRTLAALSPQRTVVPVPAGAATTSRNTAVSVLAGGVSAPRDAVAAPSDAAVSMPAGWASAPRGAAVTPRDAAWIASLGERAVTVAPLAVADALARMDLHVTSMGRPLERDAQACAWIGAAAAWLAATP